MKKLLLISAALFFTAGIANGQSIEVGELGTAQAYEPGPLSSGNGGLGSDLWRGTSATTANRLIKKLPQNYKNPIARDLAKAALLSAGAPPSGEQESAFQKIRLDAIIQLSEMAAAQDIIRRTPELANNQALQADLALLGGNVTEACDMSDRITDARSQPDWMKLRAFCHVERGEAAAAELTLDLLGSSGHSDPAFGSIMRYLMKFPGKPNIQDVPPTALNIAMIQKAGLDWPGGQAPQTAQASVAVSSLASSGQRLDALLAAGDALSDNQIAEILGILGTDIIDSNLAGGTPQIFEPPNLDKALSDGSAKGFAQLFRFARESNGSDQIRALTALLIRADRAGAFTRFSDLMENQLQTIDYNQLPSESLPIITRAAIGRNDVVALQQIYGVLGDNPEAQNRVALAADALGNGFLGGNLGTDIDGRLEQTGTKQTRALRDSLLAHALGANLSPQAIEVIDKKHSMGRLSGEAVSLSAAAKNRAQAETALRVALMLEGNPGSTVSLANIYLATSALHEAGLTGFASRLAAEDFVANISR